MMESFESNGFHVTKHALLRFIDRSSEGFNLMSEARAAFTTIFENAVPTRSEGDQFYYAAEGWTFVVDHSEGKVVTCYL